MNHNTIILTAAGIKMKTLVVITSIYHHARCCRTVEHASNVFMCFNMFTSRIYLEHADDVLKAVKEIVEEGVPELSAKDGMKDGSSSSWPTLNK